MATAVAHHLAAAQVAVAAQVAAGAAAQERAALSAVSQGAG